MNCPIHVVEKTHKMNISAYIIIYHPTPQLRTMAPWFFLPFKIQNGYILQVFLPILGSGQHVSRGTHRGFDIERFCAYVY